MSELPDLNSLSGAELSSAQLQGILNQIDLDIANLLRDGKLAAARYTADGPAGQMMDRAANLQALLAARRHYAELLQARPAWEVSHVPLEDSHE